MSKLFAPVEVIHSDLDCCGFTLYFTDENEQHSTSIFCDGGLEVYIGALCEWSSVVENILHELFEAYLMKEGKRFANTKEPWEYSSVNSIFVFNHMEFQLMCRCLGKNISCYLPDIYKVWVELNVHHNTQLRSQIKKNIGVKEYDRLIKKK